MLTKKNLSAKAIFMNNNIAKEDVTKQLEDKILWRKKGSSLDGYNYTIYTKKNRKLYQVDYSIPSLKVRLLLEDSTGRRFWSEIQKGKIIRSNSIIKGKNAGVNIPDPISEEKDIFSKVPDKEVFNLVGGNHGIGYDFAGKPIQDKTNNSPKNQAEKKMEKNVISALDNHFQKETKKRYFHNPLFDGKRKIKRGTKFKFSDYFHLRFFRNLIETALILLLGFMAIYYQWVSPISTGAMIATSGVVLGGIDILGRGEEPGLSKVLILMLVGGGLYFRYFFNI